MATSSRGPSHTAFSSFNWHRTPFNSLRDKCSQESNTQNIAIGPTTTRVTKMKSLFQAGSGSCLSNRICSGSHREPLWILHLTASRSTAYTMEGYPSSYPREMRFVVTDREPQRGQITLSSTENMAPKAAQFEYDFLVKMQQNRRFCLINITSQGEKPRPRIC